MTGASCHTFYSDFVFVVYLKVWTEPESVEHWLGKKYTVHFTLCGASCHNGNGLKQQQITGFLNHNNYGAQNFFMKQQRCKKWKQQKISNSDL